MVGSAGICFTADWEHIGGVMKIKNPEVKCERKSTTSTDPRVVLGELFNLLEDYGPAWYSVTHRRRAIAALSSAQASVSERRDTTAA